MHLGKDSTCPPVDPSKKRVYSMRFCPYAESALIALGLKCIDYERVDIKLQDKKPAWYLDINPKGSVPTLVLEDGQKITQSLEIMEFADKIAPCCGHNFALVTDAEKEKHAAAIAADVKLRTAFYALMFNADVDISRLIAMKESMTFYEANITGPYYHGDAIKFTDIFIFPMFERLEAAFKMADQPFPTAEFPKLLAYIEKFSSLPAVKERLLTTEFHLRYAMSHKAGCRDYDME